MDKDLDRADAALEGIEGMDPDDFVEGFLSLIGRIGDGWEMTEEAMATLAKAKKLPLH